MANPDFRYIVRRCCQCWWQTVWSTMLANICKVRIKMHPWLMNHGHTGSFHLESLEVLYHNQYETSVTLL